MDLDFFHRILSVDSTSGKEAELADMLAVELSAPGRRTDVFEVGDGTRNLLVSWGEPKVVFCTHLDTVPPYISPEFSESKVTGRGSSDAKGQIFAMYEACKVLESKGHTDFGLLLLAGEETGSFGAKAFSAMAAETGKTWDWVIVGEPTDNCMASAAKGTKSFEVTFTGIRSTTTARRCFTVPPRNLPSFPRAIRFWTFIAVSAPSVFPWQIKRVS